MRTTVTVDDALYWLLVTGYWLLVTGYWLLGYWVTGLLGSGYWGQVLPFDPLLVTGVRSCLWLLGSGLAF